MTTAKRTTLVRHLHLDIGYERDTDPSVLASAVLESLEGSKLINEMGIVFVGASSTSGAEGTNSMTIYAPLDEVHLEAPADPPQTPSSSTGEPPEEGAKVCPNCGKNGRPDEGGYDDKVGFELCDDCEWKPNL